MLLCVCHKERTLTISINLAPSHHLVLDTMSQRKKYSPLNSPNSFPGTHTFSRTASLQWMLLLNESSIHPSCTITMFLVHAYQKTVSKQYILDYLDLFLGTIYTKTGLLFQQTNLKAISLMHNQMFSQATLDSPVALFVTLLCNSYTVYLFLYNFCAFNTIIIFH